MKLTGLEFALSIQFWLAHKPDVNTLSNFELDITPQSNKEAVTFELNLSKRRFKAFQLKDKHHDDHLTVE